MKKLLLSALFILANGLAYGQATGPYLPPGFISGDCANSTGAGALTCTLTNGVAFGPYATTAALSTAGLVLTTSGGVLSSILALPAANEPAHTGDMTNTAGSLATTVKGINGTLLSGLTTGVLVNTTTTGVPSIATSATTFPGTATTATNLSGTTVGSIPYQSASATTSYLSNVAVGSILASAGVTTAPAYTNTPTISGFGTSATALTITAPNSFAGTAILINTGTSPNSTLLNIEANGTTEFSVGSAGAVTAVKYVLTGGTCVASSTAIINSSSTNLAICSGATTDATFTASNQTFNGSTIDMPSIASSSAATTGTVCWTTSTGNLTVDTTLACLSSTGKIKKNIQPLDVGLDEVMALRPVSYDLKPQYNPKGLGPMVGLVAEDVQQVDPRLVGLDSKGRPLGVRYMQLTAVLIKGMQEQQAEIKDLKAQLAALQSH